MALASYSDSFIPIILCYFDSGISIIFFLGLSTLELDLSILPSLLNP